MEFKKRQPLQMVYQWSVGNPDGGYFATGTYATSTILSERGWPITVSELMYLQSVLVEIVWDFCPALRKHRRDSIITELHDLTLHHGPLTEIAIEYLTKIHPTLIDCDLGLHSFFDKDDGFKDYTTVILSDEIQAKSAKPLQNFSDEIPF